MSNTALKISTTAAFITGVGIMPQTSTESKPFLIYHPTIVAKSLIASQTASSTVHVDILEMHRIGEYNYQRLQEISRLKYGWDGHNAPPIPMAVINRAKDLLMILPDGAKVFPTARSTVQIEYHKNADNYFEIEVSAKTYEIYSVKGDEEFEGNVHKREIKNRVKVFLA